MSLHICPRCNTRYTRQEHSGDFVHDCAPAVSPALRNEDIVVIGKWSDYTGTGGTSSRSAFMQGATNRLQGTRAAIEGYNFDGVTRRGNRSSTHRIRRHEEYIGNPDGEENDW